MNQPTKGTGMNAQQYNQGIKLITMAALKSGLSMTEVIGVLEIAKANVIKRAISKPDRNIVQVAAPIPPGLEQGQG
ncbi:MAG: hypothetical protein D4R57_01050 [Verrucomicrobiales bacterium]|nr:MAG: hypothetical protein D4R57_01050 [Verrucomicrobiales bacterium]